MNYNNNGRRIVTTVRVQYITLHQLLHYAFASSRGQSTPRSETTRSLLVVCLSVSTSHIRVQYLCTSRRGHWFNQLLQLQEQPGRVQELLQPSPLTGRLATAGLLVPAAAQLTDRHDRFGVPFAPRARPGSTTAETLGARTTERGASSANIDHYQESSGGHAAALHHRTRRGASRHPAHRRTAGRRWFCNSCRSRRSRTNFALSGGGTDAACRRLRDSTRGPPRAAGSYPRAQSRDAIRRSLRTGESALEPQCECDSRARLLRRGSREAAVRASDQYRSRDRRRRPLLIGIMQSQVYST